MSSSPVEIYIVSEEFTPSLLRVETTLKSETVDFSDY